MINRRKYSDKEIEEIMKHIVILIDTREQCPDNHIKNYFDSHKVEYKDMALPAGDYSFMLKAIPELGIEHDMYFYNDVVIERKHNLDELSSNFAQERARFNSEWSRMRANRKYLLIENASYDDIVNHNYRTKYSEKSYLGSIHSFNSKYGVEIVFMPDQAYSPIYIYGVCSYYLRYLIK